MQKPQCGMRRLFAYFSRFANIVLWYRFFQKQASNDHLTQANLLKWTLLNEKQNICSQYGVVTFQNILRVILWTFIWDTNLFAVKQSCQSNLVIDCWLFNKWNNVRPLLKVRLLQFYVIFLVRYAVINYIVFFSSKRKQGVSNCFRPLFSSIFATVASKLISQQKEKEK